MNRSREMTVSYRADEETEDALHDRLAAIFESLDIEWTGVIASRPSAPAVPDAEPTLTDDSIGPECP